MKLTALITTMSALAINLLHGQAQDEYLNWIRQIQTEQSEEGKPLEIVQDIYVDSRGSDRSPLGIPDGGALFQLWTVDTTSLSSWLLDSAVVGASRPRAQITIESKDSYAGVLRTRADIPFSLTIDYFNLQSPGEGIPTKLTQVTSLHHKEVAGNSQAISHEVITENQTVTQPQFFTSIIPPNELPAYKAEGVEHFSVKTFSDSSETNTIASAKIEVYPLTTGTLEPFAEGPILKSVPESINFEVDGAYPGSEIILQASIITPPQTSDAQPTERVIDLVHRNIHNLGSENLKIKFSEMELLSLGNRETITVRLLSKSVFDTLILDEITGTTNFDLLIRGSINTF